MTLDGRMPGAVDGRRGQELYSVRAIDGGGDEEMMALEIRGSDLTWIAHIVERIHASSSESNAYWKQDHPLDDAITLVATPAEIKAACSSLVQDLDSVVLSRSNNNSNGEIIRLDGPLASYSFANLIRRALLTRIPVLAADSITVERNDSSTQDEVLAHRIGQIALLFSPEEETGTLDVEAGDHERVILAEDIKFTASPIITVAPGDAKVPLGCLPPGGAIKLNVTTRVGVGLRHAKYAAVASVPMVPDVQFETMPNADMISALLAAGFICDENRRIRRTDGGAVRVERIAEVLDCTVPNLKVVNPPPGFSLYVESLGQRTSSECLHEAKRAILNELREALLSVP